jgi:predicted small lipoprotein YifL
VLHLPRVEFARFAAPGAVAAALAALLLLAGCGRKPAGLDAPPALAAAGDAQQAAASGPATGQKPAIGPDGKPLPPPVEKRKTFLDWLID